MARQKRPDKTLYPYNTPIWQPSWCCSTLSIMSLNWYKCYILSCGDLSCCYHWLLSIHMCTCIFVFPSISHLGVLDRGYHWTGRYFKGITALVFPMFTLVLVLGVSVLDVLDRWKCKVLVLDYEYLKYLSTWPIVLDPQPWYEYVYFMYHA